MCRWRTDWGTVTDGMVHKVKFQTGMWDWCLMLITDRWEFLAGEVSVCFSCKTQGLGKVVTK